jgi:hypothetical protein
MAHFAELNNQGIVLRVIVVDNNKIEDENGDELESIGIQFCRSLFGEETNWIQTSYNGNIRKNYAAIGDTYDISRDAFISPKPYDSWILNEETCAWESPVPYLDDGNLYFWNEEEIQWNLSES